MSPYLESLNIEANPISDTLINAELASQNLLEVEEHLVLPTLLIEYRRRVKAAIPSLKKLDFN